MASSTDKKIVEIVVKTTGAADIKRLASELAAMRKEATASRRELQQTNKTLEGFGKTFSTVSKAFGAGFVLKSLVQSSQVMQDLKSNVQEVAAEFIDATAEALGFTDILDDEFWKTAKQGAHDLASAIGAIDDALGDARDNSENSLLWKLTDWAGSGGLGGIAWDAYTKKVVADAEALQRQLAAISRGPGTPLMEGVFVTASVSQGVREDRAAAAQAFREAQRLAKEQLKAQEAFYAQVDALRLQVSQQHLLTDALGESAEKYDYIRATLEETAKIEKFLNEARDAGITDLEAQEAALREIYDSLRLIANEQQQIRDIQQEIADFAKENAESLKQMASEMKQPMIDTGGFEEAIKFMEEMNELQSSLKNQVLAWGDALSNAFKGVLTQELHNTRDLLRSITNDMRNFYAELAAREAATQLMKWAGVAFGALMGAERGAAFDRGQVIPMARGGIISTPTLFPMARGMGLMGEAGPEAVMPLKRGSDGKLGVASAMPSIQIVNNLGVAATASTRRDGDRMQIILEAATMGADMAQAQMNRSVTSGYGTTAQSFQRAYGLRRRV
jgi:hypothetical protein